MGRLYSIDDFQNMLFLNLEYKIPDSVKHILKHIEAQLDVSEPTTTHTHTHTHIHKDHVSGSSHNNHSKPFGRKSQPFSGNGVGGIDKKKAQGKKEVSGEEWEAMRNFKSTKIGVKSGIDKVWNDIRVVLNKMSSASYEKIKDQALVLIGDYFSGEYNNEDNGKMLATNILALCGGNKMYVELFSNFYLELFNKYELFRECMDAFVDETFSQNIVEYVDADVDYDGYCVYNKITDTRKNKNALIVKLMKKGMVSREKVLDIIKWYITQIETNIVLENRSKEVEDLTENLFILVSNNTSEFDTFEVWTDDILVSIETLGKSNNKSFPSISNRIVFKFVDILDSL